MHSISVYFSSVSTTNCEHTRGSILAQFTQCCNKAKTLLNAQHIASSLFDEQSQILLMNFSS